ncbi:MAG TPA: hypothetical protein VFY10_05445 [Dehalococcoidia bacterium]|nr:hypothetical protein [Dehalococcoidia bacterium]
MKASTFWKTVVADKSEFLDRVIALLTENGIRYAVIGGQGVNAYADPVVSLDLDIAVALDQINVAERLLAEHFKVERFPHSLNVTEVDSDLRLQVQTDERYPPFVERAEARAVLGKVLSVAAIEDVLQGKVWAASDPTRRSSKRLKDLSDIARIIEVRPDLIDRVPDEIKQRL